MCNSLWLSCLDFPLLYPSQITLKTSENLSKPLKTSEALPLRDPLRDPLRGRFPSQNLSGLLPLFVLPLDLSPNFGRDTSERAIARGARRALC